MGVDSLALTFDFGTQSVRVALVDKKGEIVDIVKTPYDPPYFSKQKGFAEQEPDYYFECAMKCLKDLCKRNEDKMYLIIGATITTFRDTSVQLDGDYKPIRPCILWLDQRTAKAEEKIPKLHWLIFTLIGMKDTIKFNRSRTIAHWLKENEPETWAKTKKYVNISTYLTYKFTGKLVDSAACVIGHYPIDFKKRKWYESSNLKAAIFGIPKKMLCEIKKPGEQLGVISEEIANRVGLPLGIKVYASGSDKACETVGLGALNNDFAAISYGTASTVEVSNIKYHEPEKFLPAYPAAVPGWYNMEVQIYRGFWMLSWFCQNFAKELQNSNQKLCLEEIMNSKIASIPPGSDGLVLQPYWGPGLSRPLSKGAVIGFSDAHTRDHLYRAIIEGIAYGLKDGLTGIEKSQRHKVSRIRISGGGSQSDIICQITADVFNLPVSRVQTFETTSLGAAIAVFLASKEFSNVDEANYYMIHQGKTFYPNPIAVEQYNYLYKGVYLKMYPKLKNVYKTVTSYNKKY